MGKVLSMSFFVDPQVNVHPDISECDAGAAASREHVARCGQGACRPCRWNKSSGYIVGMTSKPWLGGHHTTCCGLQHHDHYIHVNHHLLRYEHVNPHPVPSSVLDLSSLANTWHVSWWSGGTVQGSQGTFKASTRTDVELGHQNAHPHFRHAYLCPPDYELFRWCWLTFP